MSGIQGLGALSRCPGCRLGIDTRQAACQQLLCKAEEPKPYKL